MARLIHYDERPVGLRNQTPESIYGLRVSLRRETYEVPAQLTKALAGRLTGPFASKYLVRMQAERAVNIIESGDVAPDAIYTRHPVVASRLLSRLPSTYASALCVEIHSLPERMTQFQRDVAILKRLPKIVSITGAMKERLVSAGVEKEKILVAHDAVDDELFAGPGDQAESRRKLELPSVGRNICFVGRFEQMGKEKGIAQIISSASYLFKRYSDIYFTLVGGPESEIPRYKKLVSELGLPNDRFIFPGYRPIHEIEAYLAAADVLLMPTPFTYQYAFNTSPLKLFQYLTAGRPIVASDLPAVREVVGDNCAALLPEPGNALALAEAIEKVLTDDDLARKLSVRAVELSKKYTWRTRARSIIDFLDA